MKNEGDSYREFQLINSTTIEELKTHLREMIHLPTGAQVMHLENDDPENVFCLSFKTLPSNSNGAAHILEHTVLCGSRKYPIKDPFFSMSRRSLNTFMNALTGADFTCYPAATQVEKDFYNLLEVYLDAVFHPLLNEDSFLQEGHRLEFSKADDPTSPLEFKGIVYNEMKGALSSPDSRIWHEMCKVLVPDLPYSHNSGGDPKEIPSLSYKELIEFHETFYHPSQCLFYFYGNFPLKKHLDFITEHALKGVQKVSPIEGIGHQKQFKQPIREKRRLPTNETEELEKKHIHVLGWLTTPLLNQEEVLALTVLDSILMDTDASPLRRALLQSKLCIQADCFLDIEMTEVPLLIVMRGCAEDAKPLETLIFDELKKIAEKGIPYPLVEASVHQLEFGRTEIGGGGSPFGLTLFMRSALTKQHGCAPQHSLQVHALFKGILEGAKDPHFFSPLIEKYLLNNPHFVSLSFAPDPNLFDEEEKEEKASLSQIKKQLSEKEIAHILEKSEQLNAFQSIEEGQKVECLPKVTLLDIPAEARHFDLDQTQRKELEIFHHDTFTNQIAYADLIYDLPDLDEEEMFYLHLLLPFWTELGAGDRTFEENIAYTHAYTGGIGSHVSLHVQAHDPMRSKPSLQLHGKALKRNMGKLFELFIDTITRPHFGEKERIEELLKQLANSLQNRLPRNAMRYASQLALSGFSIPGTINQSCYGLTFFNKVMALAADPSKGAEILMGKFRELGEKVLLGAHPHLVLSCDQELFEEMDKNGFYGLPDLPTQKKPEWQDNFPLKPVESQARIFASPVAFTVEGFKVCHYLHKDAAPLSVATVLLENKILHHRIREQGGAYGSGANYNPLWGNFYFYSYRDPHIAHTLRVIRDAIHEMADGNFDQRDLEEAKLGIIQHADAPTSPGARAMTSYIWERDGKSRQMRQNFRDRLITLDKEDIQSAMRNQLLSQVNDGVVVTFAGKELIEKELPHIENKSLKVLPIST